MATLQSKTFTRDLKVRARLQRCADSDPDHIFQGHDPKGDHVSAIHAALVALVPNHGISSSELENGVYGPTTASAVLKFKSTPALNGTGKMILYAGQTKPDSIVGKQTIAALDAQLAKAEPGPEPPPPPPPPQPGKFNFLPIKAPPLLIKFGADDPKKQDLEDAPVDRSATTIKAKLATQILGQGRITEEFCKNKLLLFIMQGGAQAQEMAQFFFLNQQRPPSFFRDFKGDHFWVKEVVKDKSFTTNHANLSNAIRDALQELADGSPLTPKVVDINKLENGSSFQPRKFAEFSNRISFAFQGDHARVAGNPLAFGIGDIQGLEVRVTEFAGQPDGSYKGKLQYILWDHYGSDDGDIIDPGQASLWLLQRKMVDGQNKIGFEPYRVKITVDNVEFSGQLK